MKYPTLFGSRQGNATVSRLGFGLRFSLVVGSLAVGLNAFAGGIIVNNDEWPLTDYAFSLNLASTTNFADNVAKTLTGGSGNILIDTTNTGLTGADLNSVLTAQGYNVSYNDNYATSLDDLTLSNYQAIFVGGQFMAADWTTVLANYVKSGGGVYVAAGSGFVGYEGGYWDPFLDQFGLDLVAGNNNLPLGEYDYSGPSPVLSGVNDLLVWNGNSVFVDNSDPAVVAAYNPQILSSFDGVGLLGAAGITPLSAPDVSSTLLLLSLGVAGMFAFAHRRSGVRV